MVYELEIKNLEDLKKLAFIVKDYVFKGFVLCLGGELGAGKTTFTQFFGQSLGIDEPIHSPTFTIMKNYDGIDLPLSHIDAYRLEGMHQDMELEEYIFGEGISVIEWYAFIDESLPENYLSIHLEFTGETSRKVLLEGSGVYESIAKKISNRYRN
ncbi:MAG: tRNA (adenosine(37)-N6)-threonylcarbamoyltransferase complex ATPase subunit type 1 TsaE [Candidatus Izemoplasmataceae bacterium]